MLSLCLVMIATAVDATAVLPSSVNVLTPHSP